MACPNRTFLAVGILPLGLFSGCGEKPMVMGTVTFEGRIVERGYITFFPAEGTDNTCGAVIVDGRYCLGNIKPGKKKILVTNMPQVEVREQGNGKKKIAILPHQSIPVNAVGNNQIVEITSCTQIVDMELRNPPYP